jgi:hypothetical protein
VGDVRKRKRNIKIDVKKYYLRIQTGFPWLRTGHIGELIFEVSKRRIILELAGNYQLLKEDST